MGVADSRARWVVLVVGVLLLTACQVDDASDGESADDVGDEPTADETDAPADETDAPADETDGQAGETDAPADSQVDLPAADPFDTSAVTLTDGDERHEVPVYVADDNRLRQQGLMGWESLPDGAGMLFVFDSERRGGFWMKDTLIPLSIAFADEDGEVLAILDMEPCEEDPCPSYDPDVAYQYALEVDQGHFEELGVEPGWTLQADSG